jgi:hypothetical protein
MQTDNQLIRKIKRQQNKDAADELIQRYYREIYAFVYKQTGEKELAMDCFLQVLFPKNCTPSSLKLHEEIPHYCIPLRQTF